MSTRSPMTENDSELPVDALKPELEAALAVGDVVVTAATGSGKSTRLPLWTAETAGRVLVVQPRRLAAVSLAGFVAASRGERPGGRIGYAVRFDQRLGPDSRVVFATPGMALQWYAADALAGFNAVVLDEFHERRWDTDLLLALLRAGGGHRLVVTSATLPGESFAAFLGARYLAAEGRSYPVTVAHHAESDRAMPAAPDLVARVGDAVERALAGDDGDVLVFLPGRGEIRAAADRLRGLDAEVIGLHASAPADDQRRALRRGDRRRVILATNVAETSLTVPGVTVVVDSGLQRRTFRRNGRTVLGLAAVSAASADQRAGRAGRLAPGRALRLWGERAPLAAYTPPEIAREDLTDLVLAAGVAGRPARGLTFAESPPPHSLEQAEAGLQRIGALDADGLATERGRRLFRLPIDTWLAHLIVSMPDAATAGVMSDLAAALAAGRWLSLTGDDGKRAELDARLPGGCDASLRVAALREGRLPGVGATAAGREEARRLAHRLREAMDLPGIPDRHEPEAMAAALRAAVGAFPEAVFVRRRKRRQAMGNGTSEVLVGEGSRLRESDEAALVLDDHSVPGRGTRETVTVATCLAPVPLDALASTGLTAARISEPRWQGGALVATRVHEYAGRVVAEQAVEPDGAEARRAAAELVLAGRLLAPAGEALRDDLQAWALYVALNATGEAVPEPHEWLEGRLQALGVESGDDLLLVEPPDLRFPGIPEWERPDFDRRYPRRVRLTDLDMQAHYDLRRRTVTLEKTAGKRRRDPQRWELPAWPGWRVLFQSASRVVEVR